MSDFEKKKLLFSTDFEKSSNFMEFVIVGAKIFKAGIGRTDRKTIRRV